ncbi:MAG TPA: LEA type 2 family protein [Gemmatimonadaceae bacterium]|nr:LEA type 2 family protein [Gemmatimonadaceae bacterium]
MNANWWGVRTVAVAAVAATLAATTACASLGRASFKEPVVTFKDARITGLGVSGGSIEIVLDVYNPNRYRLEGTRLTYQVLVDSTKFGEGAYTTRFGVDEGKTSEVRLPLSFTYAGVGAAGRMLMQTGTVQYRVIGDFTVSTPVGSFTRPYDQTGRFSTLQGNARGTRGTHD